MNTLFFFLVIDLLVAKVYIASEKVEVAHDFHFLVWWFSRFSWQGTLNAANTSQTVEIPENTTTITLNLGNSKATSIKINGKKFDFLKENETLTVRTITLNVAQTTAQ